MDPPSGDVTKLPDMVMCGDHPSFTKTELNVKEVRPEDRDKPRERTPISHARITPTSSRTEQGGGVTVASEHALRALQARRRVRSLEVVPRADNETADSRALLQAAMGSFRWPPYLVCVWVCVLLLTHALHCLAGLLDRALPNIKKLCQYFRTWTEESWKAETDINHRVCPIILACITGTLYATYGVLYAAYAAALWAIEPLCPEDASIQDVIKVTDYVDDSASKTNASVKH